MTDMIPVGIDRVTGEGRPLADGDVLVSPDGTPLGSSAFSVGASQASGTSLGVILPANTLAIGQVLSIEVLIDLTPGNSGKTTLDFNSQTLMFDAPSWNGNTDTGVRMSARLQRTAAGTWTSWCEQHYLHGTNVGTTISTWGYFNRGTADFGINISIQAQQAAGVLNVLALNAWTL